MNAVRSGETFDKAPRRFVGPAAGCVAAMIAGWFIVSYDNPLTATLIITAIAFFLVAIINPKAGFYLLVLGTAYVDLVKRLGMLTGSLAYRDVVIAVAVPPILCACICVGVVLRFIIQPRSLERWQCVVLVVVLLLMISVLLKNVSGGTGLLQGLQDFANSGAYFPLILIAGILFPKPEDIKQLIKFCLIIYVPVALYAIWQQIFGLNNFEINYMQTGYTITIGLLDDLRPRPFSTLNSPHSLTAMTAVLALLAFFIHLKGSKRAAWQIPVGILFMGGCWASLSRAGWILLLIGVIGWIFFRRASTTIGFYGLVTAFLVMLIVNADPLLDSLDYFQQKLPGGSVLNEQTFRIETFSDRLYSFRNMVTNPLFHTWFGNPKLRRISGESVARDEMVHDQLTQILVQYGFVGLSGFFSLMVGALWLTHRRVLIQRDLEIRNTAIALLTVLAAVLYSGMLFGSHLGIFPVNVFFAILVGSLLVCCMQPGETAASGLTSNDWNRLR
jgi:O-antigen ligase/polysaccharide polymerase Wzy-like membrane protein